MPVEPGLYHIKNAVTWTTIDESTDGQRVVNGWKQTNQMNQLWRVQPVAGGAYSIQNAASGSFLHTNGPYNGSKLVGSKTYSTWYLDQQPGGSVYIIFPGSNHIVGLENGNVADGTSIHLWERNSTGAKHQKWYFEKRG
ncbi:unnamed protein product [Rhizoctonia solani]|uniref:Ricin B lectin domain-containing protein n=1 Tax=Rhizoctonia solani TaxID=456999 RepID=A0A8H3H7K6_9AGAM|nr:unnamed protein product [Rhizoctonia solani]